MRNSRRALDGGRSLARRTAGVLGACAIAGVLSCSADLRAPILLFTGKGTSPGDVAAFEALLRRQSLEFAEVDSSELDALDDAQLAAHELLIVPGGDWVAMSRGLAPLTAIKVRHAVERGLNYVGVCGGAFLAGDAPAGKSTFEPHFNGFDLAGGVAFPLYSGVEAGTRKAAVWLQIAGEPKLEHYWEYGPSLMGWGDVVARYPDGTPAIVESTVGRGCVILSGVHPEAPETWRGGMTFTTPAEVDIAYAAKLIEAARSRTALPHF